MNNRKCKSCNIEKPLTEFRKHTSGYRHMCMECSVQKQKTYYKTVGKAVIYSKLYGDYETYFNAQLNRRNRKKTLSVKDCIDILNNQNKKCALTGLDFVLQANSPYLPTLDRINAGGSYTKENVRIVCNAANSFRNKWSDQIFFEICKKVYENNK